MKFLSITMITVSHLLDYYSTKFGLARGAREANPIVRKLGLIQTKVLFGLIQSGLIMFLDPKTGVWVSLLTLAVYSGVATHNVRVGLGSD